jgi:hypothetical protein
MEARPPVEDLIVRSFQEALDPGEWDRLRAWRDASAENEAHYRSLARIWEVTGTVAPARVPSPPPPPLEDILRAACPEPESLRGDPEDPAVDPPWPDAPDATS